ncbi:hypothetical protein [Paraliomyxa miuraensis]|uniref:hypothetical protein n=1 Tax=Paraliomyxa miuraensis TaxID=376150 RepID=UPI002253571A|nr:hypothetical protein [Paraliomyxa miuraensis]MCX4241866.1 hypothetical protein [Paraliomyxa miuraensis]
MAARMGFQGLGVGIGIMVLASACPGDDVPTGSGTGGDEDMPDGLDPGPGGPGCVEAIGMPPGFSPHEPVAASQPGTVEHVVHMHGDAVEAESSSSQAGGPSPSSLTAAGRAVGATTQDPHIHERWGESRKIELSYCINGMPGEDAENEVAYHKMIRALHSTMAEWERVSGANFVHVREDDRPDADPFIVQQGGVQIARADCQAGTNAYFGVISAQNAAQGVTNAVPQAWGDPALEELVRFFVYEGVAPFRGAVVLQSGSPAG